MGHGARPMMLWILISLANFMGLSLVGVAGEPQVSAMFAFGDSLIDNGNNNFLSSLAKANYLPYGVDFYEGPTGRFSNGKTIIDYLGELLGLPPLPAYSNPAATGRNILTGVNYASAAAGILAETGQNLGDRIPLSEQVQSLKSNLNQLRNHMGEEEVRNYLAKALVVMVLGSNDYINNYLQPSFYGSSYMYSPQDYADILIQRYTRQILEIHNLGLRKFLLAGVGPLGCVPNRLATGLAPQGKCVDFDNNIVGMFNARLRSLVDKLNANHSGSIFVYGNTFGAFSDILNNSTSYGFTVTDRGCCGIGRNRGQITCLPFSVPCENRNKYVFWDAFHPAEAANKILAQKAYAGPPSDCYPFNVQKMVQF